jgi:hypothetical protein
MSPKSSPPVGQQKISLDLNKETKMPKLMFVDVPHLPPRSVNLEHRDSARGVLVHVRSNTDTDILKEDNKHSFLHSNSPRVNTQQKPTTPNSHSLFRKRSTSIHSTSSSIPIIRNVTYSPKSISSAAPGIVPVEDSVVANPVVENSVAPEITVVEEFSPPDTTAKLDKNRLRIQLNETDFSYLSSGSPSSPRRRSRSLNEGSPTSGSNVSGRTFKSQKRAGSALGETTNADEDWDTDDEEDDKYYELVFHNDKDYGMWTPRRRL